MSYKLVSKPLSEEQTKMVNDIIEKNGSTKKDILNTLIELQDSLEEKYIGEEVAKIVSDKIGIPLVDLYDILTFYDMLSTKPRAKYKIEVCTCASCYLNGSDSLVDIVERNLGIKLGEHTDDWLFEFEKCSCVGACEIGPIIKVGNEIYGNLNERLVASIIGELRDNKDL
ncbi:NAD(P)H-dependent oxidoreductase subunit E [Miniphocaeibacter halophilus]|uniref:NAD(P)H-dependent oxidoreductase subunit E n=1 Tax=Miniphocaeibacter halophilus TaxID=2931922 RepID=A0AC61MP22_9FIRM|nr:NAD(P)H-dependent oxidoreductase subunit E [Miniphocaeibacter halophilus]QQK06868.1 NAD(P)H-dependent oxidoreductase subunit E [Miniphocaeibacter halophilus]